MGLLLFEKLILEMPTMRGQQHSFSTHERVDFFTQMSRPEGDSNPQPLDSCQML